MCVFAGWWSGTTGTGPWRASCSSRTSSPKTWAESLTARWGTRKASTPAELSWWRRVSGQQHNSDFLSEFHTLTLKISIRFIFVQLLSVKHVLRMFHSKTPGKAFIVKLVQDVFSEHSHLLTSDWVTWFRVFIVICTIKKHVLSYTQKFLLCFPQNAEKYKHLKYRVNRGSSNKIKRCKSEKCADVHV